MLATDQMFSMHPIPMAEIIKQRVTQIANNLKRSIFTQFCSVENELDSLREPMLVFNKYPYGLFLSTTQRIYESREVNVIISSEKSAIRSVGLFYFHLHLLHEAVARQHDGYIQTCLWGCSYLCWFRHCSPHPWSHAALLETRPFLHY